MALMWKLCLKNIIKQKPGDFSSIKLHLLKNVSCKPKIINDKLFVRASHTPQFIFFTAQIH